MRPLIVKAKFLLPGPSRHEAARDYLRYIANPTRDDLARWEETLRQRDVESEASIYAIHIQERRGSQGLFGPELSGPVKEEMLEEVFGNHGGPICTMIVSVRHDDAVAELPHLMGRAAWEDACRSVMAPMAENMGIPEKDLRWVAAMHRRPKDGSPHVHILFWSNDPARGVRRRRGQTYHTISPKALDQAKRLWTSELYGPVRERLGVAKSGIRALARETGWQVLGNSEADQLGTWLAEIGDALPGHGRLAYAYMPPAVRAQVDEVTDWLLKLPDMAAMAARYGDIAAEMATHYSMDPVRHDQARQNALADLRRRLATAILRRAASVDKDLAWGQVTEDIWSAAHGHGAPDSEVTAAVRLAVNQVASGRIGPEAAARALLGDPALAGHMAGLAAAADKAGDTEYRRRLEAAVANRLARAADYARAGRAYRASIAAGSWSAAMAKVIRDAERAERKARLAEAEMAAQPQAGVGN